MTTKDFADYVGDFYAADRGIYKRFFNDELSQQTINSFMPDFIRFRGESFCGDTIDREILRDIMLVSLGYQNQKDVECDGGVANWFYSTHILEREMLNNKEDN